MRKIQGFGTTERKWLLPLVASSLVSLLLVAAVMMPSGAARRAEAPQKVIELSGSTAGAPAPPRLAYLISGSNGDGERMKRLLQAVYHPRNQYLLHLDRAAPDDQRISLAFYVQSIPVFTAAANVNVVGKADFVSYMGPTAIASTLHAAALLLRLSKRWYWFINLSASDYPLITQDGSASVVLSRNFMEYCILGWDNLPRTVLMYSANVLLSQEGYFHTVICNAQGFRNTTVNNDLRYVVWDTPPKPEPRYLNLSDYKAMTDSGAAFARQFLQDDWILNKIDQLILHRRQGRLVPGGWCVGKSNKNKDPCSVWGDISILKPGLGAKRFEKLLLRLIANETFRSSQCKFE